MRPPPGTLFSPRVNHFVNLGWLLTLTSFGLGAESLSWALTLIGAGSGIDYALWQTKWGLALFDELDKTARRGAAGVIAYNEISSDCSTV
ncbi:MAG: hypothetical protein F2763_02255 [Actinobacteria bacterium]|nr:hypothetical protein [Actinomycetota bacterium]